MNTILKLNGVQILRVDKGVLNINPGQKMELFGFNCMVTGRDKTLDGDIVIETHGVGGPKINQLEEAMTRGIDND